MAFNQTSNLHGDCDNYDITRTWTATDECGNQTVHTQNIIVQDTTAPTFDLPLPSDITIDCGDLSQPEILNAYDNCGNATVTVADTGYTDTDCANNTIIRTWIAIDFCGNTTTHSQTITLQDTTAPIFDGILPEDLTVECDLIPDAAILTASDDCSTVSTTFIETSDNDGSGLTYNIFRVWTATDACGNETEHIQKITVTPCCRASISTITVYDDICPTDELYMTTTALPASGGPSYRMYYTVTNTNDDILILNNSGVFTTEDIEDVASSSSVDGDYPYNLDPGHYNIFAYHVDTLRAPSPMPSVDVNANDVGNIDPGCFAVLKYANTIYIPEPIRPFVGESINVQEGYNGGLNPIYYNTNQITVSGGVFPYSYDWNHTGYVRYEIIDNGNNTVTINIIYSDTATWSIAISDNSNCTNHDLSFTNDPATPQGSGSILDIYTYNIISDNGSNSGNIYIYAEGGSPECGNHTGYSYAWSGPSNWDGTASASSIETANGPSISDLPSGWYTVTVTDCADTEQMTIGWYWVPEETRGRGKSAANINEKLTLTVTPNPFDQKTSIKFGSNLDTHISLNIYDMQGNHLVQLADDDLVSENIYTVPFSGSNLTSGIYLCTLRSKNGNLIHQKLVVQH